MTTETSPLDIHNAIASKGIFNIKGVSIPENISQDEWAEIHRTIIMCCTASNRWKKQSRDCATNKWGIDYAVQREIQIEMELGIEFPEEKPKLNPSDKSVGIFTIQATNSSFLTWERKMHDEIPTWDVPTLKELYDLLAPMEQKAQEVRNLIQEKEQGQ